MDSLSLNLQYSYPKIPFIRIYTYSNYTTLKTNILIAYSNIKCYNISASVIINQHIQ